MTNTHVMTNTQVVHVRHYHGPHKTVYIGRPQRGFPWRFGNPFPITESVNRTKCIERYRLWLQEGLTFGNPDATPERRQWILDNLPTLRGKKLACFCKPQACHGDVLVEMLERMEVIR